MLPTLLPATPDEAQVVTNRTRIEEEAAKQKAAQAEAAALAAAEKAAARRQRLALLQKRPQRGPPRRPV